MKIGIICIICEFFSVAGILYALVCGAKLQEILAGVLLMLFVSLLVVRAGNKRNVKKAIGPQSGPAVKNEENI